VGRLFELFSLAMVAAIHFGPTPAVARGTGVRLNALPPTAQVTTFGADLSRAPDVPFDCTVFPLGNGATQPVVGPESSCTWTTATGGTSPSAGLLTPAGAGVISTVRVRVGPITGPMQIVVLTVEVNATTGRVGCCTAAYVSPTFTPAADAVTTLSTNLPVQTDGPGQESSPGLHVGDILALSILGDGVPIPLVNVTGSGEPPIEQPSDFAIYPAYVQGQTMLASGTYGYLLDMNADWTPLTSGVVPAPSVRQRPSAVTRFR
jgi:hypothetical protein